VTASPFVSCKALTAQCALLGVLTDMESAIVEGDLASV